MLAVMLLLHITLAIVINGGAFAIGGVMGALLSQPKEAALPVLRICARMENILGPAAILVPLFGVGMVFSSNDVYKISQFWAYASLILFVAYAALGVGPARVTSNLLIARLEAAPAGSTAAGVAPDLVKRFQLIGIGFLVLNILFVVLMVWRPGGPGNINDYTG